jgi:hypothetical protein
MTGHKFVAGQSVSFLAGRDELNIPSGTYTIVRPLPAEGREWQYRVKNTHDGHERVMRESQLASMTPPSFERMR